MPLLADDLARIREWVGSSPDDGDVATVYERVGEDPLAAALSILRTRRADMLAEPATWAVSGEYSQSTKDNLAALDRQIADLETLVPGESTSGLISTVQLVRPDLER